MTKMSMTACREAARCAQDKFNGDILAGVGYVVCRSIVANQGKNEEPSLKEAAENWALRRKDESKWQKIVSLFTNNDEDERSVDHESESRSAH
jgi:hypothetical protein